MSCRELELETKLSLLTEQFLVEQKINKQLHVDIGLAYDREKYNLEALTELKRLLNDAVAEKEKLEAENDMLRSYLSESRLTIQQNEIADDEATDEQAICRFSQVSKSSNDEEQNGNSFSLSSGGSSNELQAEGSLREEAARKTWHLEQQILALTRDKKQLMTHLHWLSRKRAEQSGHDYIQCQLESEARNVSLEEGNGVKLKSILARFSTSAACSTREGMHEAEGNVSPIETKCIVGNTIDTSEINDYDESIQLLLGAENRKELRDMQFAERQYKGRQPEERQLTERQLTERQLTERQLTERQLTERQLTERQLTERQLTERQLTERRLTEKQLKDKLESLKAMLLVVKGIAAKNNETCDSIFQLSFQNIKHPNEPRSYCTWSSHDEEHISSLVKSQETMNALKSNEYLSLQSCSDLQNDGIYASIESQGTVKKIATSHSPLELNEEKESRSNEHSGNSSSFDTPYSTISPLSENLSDLDNMYSPSTEEHLEHYLMARGSRKPFFSTSANSSLQIARSSTHNSDFQRSSAHNSDYQTTPHQFNSPGRIVRQRATESSEDGSHSFLSASSASTTMHYPENLIS